ncbi:DUF4232 domain-containing protein [Arthrobacter crusticola]|uniref:DUF4232 domain-containing protein n=1 Tax=Arthrobacter crusticola TaxID=2547960 RepID=A0A4R5TUS1_9MICC|nr:DUF4232 domain-containing protein [Arthrobacter crusticola]TDK24824.1 DUF4232 domain-containing protein [Arthrobacter crusticola]
MTSGTPHWILAAVAIGTATLLGACAPAASEPTGAEAPAASEAASVSPTASEAPSAPPAPTASSSPSPSPSSAPADPEPDPEPTEGDGGVCTAADLSGAVTTGPGAGAAGSAYRTLTLTNTSGAACDMAGYPGVSYVDAAGTQLGAPADRGEPGGAFTLEPGASATAVLQQVNAGNYGADCGAVPAAGVRVYPPGATDSLVLPQEITACSASSIVLMTVGAMQPAG